MVLRVTFTIGDCMKMIIDALSRYSILLLVPTRLRKFIVVCNIFLYKVIVFYLDIKNSLEIVFDLKFT